jgi:hypothetical protein
MCATARASFLYARHRLTGRPLAWSKTKHEFPDHPESGAFARSIEDAVIDEGFVLRRELEALLEKGPELSAPRALLANGVIDEAQFTNLWARHSGLAFESVLPGDLDKELLEKWPEENAVRFEAIPIRQLRRGDIQVGFVEPPAERVLRRCMEILDAPVEPLLVRPASLLNLRHRIYPRLVLDGGASDPLEAFLENLPPSDLARVREFQAQRGCDEAHALEALRLAAPQDLRELFAKAWQGAPVDLATKSFSLSIVRALGPLFCEVHRLLPLHDGSLAIGGPLHPGVAARIREIFGGEAPIQTDTPTRFQAAWRKFVALQAAQNALLDQLVANGDLSTENRERIVNMLRVVEGPVDRLLIQFGLVNRHRIHAALRRAGGVETAADNNHRGDPLAEHLFAPGFSRRAGVVVADLSPDGATLRLDGLLSKADLAEVHTRCEGLPVRFELFPA